RLSDDVLVFFPGGQVERPRLVVRLAAVSAHTLVGFLHVLQRQMLAMLELGIAPISDANVFDNLSIRHFPVRGLDKSKLIDARKTGETGDQSDVRTFRGLNGTYSSIVSGMNVANFEPRTLTRKAARSECR